MPKLTDDERDRLDALRGSVADAAERATRAFEDVDRIAELRARRDEHSIDLPDPGVIAFEATRELTVAVQEVAEVLGALLDDRLDTSR